MSIHCFLFSRLCTSCILLLGSRVSEVCRWNKMKGSNEATAWDVSVAAERHLLVSSKKKGEPLTFPPRMTSLPPRSDTVCCLLCDLSRYIKQKDQHSRCAFQGFISAPVNISELLQHRPPLGHPWYHVVVTLVKATGVLSSAGHGMMSSASWEPFLLDPFPPQDEPGFIGMETSYMCFWVLRFGGEHTALHHLCPLMQIYCAVMLRK